MTVFFCTFGYWVHEYSLCSELRVHEDVDGDFTAQDFYTFRSTSQEEHGEKAPSMCVETYTRFTRADGSSWTTRPGYWNSNKTLQWGRKLYKKLLTQGYTIND